MGRARTYGECQRSGFRVPVERLTRDGYRKGLVVDDQYYDPPHPQDEKMTLRPERHSVPAPELSKPPDEGTAAPEIEFDSLGFVVFEEE